MTDQPAYEIHIPGLEGSEPLRPTSASASRPWIGIRFNCCGVYTRVYRNREGTAYRGACPRCGQPVTLRVGPGGTDARFFVAE